MSDNDLSAASAAAAEMIHESAGEPAPAPAPEAAPAEGGAEETFPRSYVEELRQEAARYRTTAKPYEEAFASMSESERRGFLDLASDLNSSPERALEGFERVVANLRERTGQAAGDPVQAPDADNQLLTPQQVQAIVDSKLRERDTAAEQNGRVQGVFDQAAALNPAYAEGSDALVQLLHVAQTDPAAGGTLDGAHMVLMGKLEALQAQAIEEYRESLSGRSTRRPVSGGTPTTGKPAEPITDLKEATKRANEILGRSW